MEAAVIVERLRCGCIRVSCEEGTVIIGSGGASLHWETATAGQEVCSATDDVLRKSAALGVPFDPAGLSGRVGPWPRVGEHQDEGEGEEVTR